MTLGTKCQRLKRLNLYPCPVLPRHHQTNTLGSLSLSYPSTSSSNKLQKAAVYSTSMSQHGEPLVAESPQGADPLSSGCRLSRSSLIWANSDERVSTLRAKVSTFSTFPEGPGEAILCLRPRPQGALEPPPQLVGSNGASPSTAAGLALLTDSGINLQFMHGLSDRPDTDRGHPPFGGEQYKSYKQASSTCHSVGQFPEKANERIIQSVLCCTVIKTVTAETLCCTPRQQQSPHASVPEHDSKNPPKHLFQ